MSIIGNGILCGGSGGGGGGLQYETGTVTTNGRYINITHNLNTLKTMVFYELADLSAVPTATSIGGVCGTKIYGTGQTATGHAIGVKCLTGYYRSSSTGEVKDGLIMDNTSDPTTSSVSVDTGITTTATRTYKYVIVAMP